MAGITPTLTPIRRVLIANRGEIAIRIARAARSLEIIPLGIASETDSNALHRVAMAESVVIGPGPAQESYLHSERILQAARQLNADAIHPGYGFLSESAAFAQAVGDAGLIFIGPSPATLALAGDKRQARQLAQSLGIPTLAGYDGPDQSDARLQAHAERLGFPLLIKASNGGGGRGQRVVRDPAEFLPALAAARREAKAAFGDASVLLERYLEQPRHIEFQILADAHGSIFELGERDCSLQRRRQKVLEEAPAPQLPATLRNRMGKDALALAQACAYRNIGTVEFLLDASGQHYFLEINARLQVEHPVTELVHQVDLVAQQFHIASGAKLSLPARAPQGWALEARICAEDPAQGLLPSSGEITGVSWPNGPGIRIENGIDTGSSVPIDYDSLVAKLCVWAQTREEAFARLREALDATQISGVATNLPVLRAMAADPHINHGPTSTNYLDDGDLLRANPTPPASPLLIAVTQELLREQAQSRVGSVGIPLFFTLNDTNYALSASLHGDSWECTALNLPGIRSEQFADFRCAAKAPQSDMLQTARYALCSPLDWPTAQTTETVPNEASSGNRVTAPMPGRVLQLSATPGQAVAAHDVVAILEAMKMEHRIEAGCTGVISQIHIHEGQTVAAGTLLLEIAPAQA